MGRYHVDGNESATLGRYRYYERTHKEKRLIVLKPEKKRLEKKESCYRVLKKEKKGRE
jgi:hypothetical protein